MSKTMCGRYLFGPVTTDFADQNLRRQRRAGACLAFNAAGDADLTVRPDDTWEAIGSRLPSGWRPDFIALYVPYTAVPPCLWSAPVPLVGLAPDWNLLWHHYRLCLPRCDLVLTDTAGVEALHREGIRHARAANLFGCERRFLEDPEPEPPRDIDVLFVGNLSPAVQRERLPWLGRLARLAGRWNVVIGEGVRGDAYRDLVRRARVVFNRSIRGECNRRALEATAAGALLFQEAGNREVPAYFADRHECVYYTDDDLEDLLEHYLEHEEERRAIAAAGQARARALTFEALWEEQVGRIGQDWPALCERARARCARGAGPSARSRPEDLTARTWQALAAGRVADPALVPDLALAVSDHPGEGSLHSALGLAVTLAGQAPGPTTGGLAAQALGYFLRAAAADPADPLAALNLAEALVGSGQTAEAARQGHQALALLAASGGAGSPPDRWLNAGHFPPVYDLFRVEWERAAWSHAGDPSAEARAKRLLLRWRLHALLADLTGDLVHAFEAAQARPDLSPAQAALGCTLARHGRPGEAAEHLARAVAANPFDAEAARALFQARGAAGDGPGQRLLARDRRLLATAAPQVVAPEPWFVDAPPVGDELASLIILCCDQLDYTRLCLESVLRHTRPPYELVLVDNGSTDGTAAFLEEVRTLPGPERVAVIRNEANLGFPAGVNQGLKEARGRYLVLLNNDTVVTEGWLDGLVALSLHDWPHTGLVGAVTNCASPPQEVPAGYRTREGIDAFARRRKQEFSGRALAAERLVGFCLLIQREVLDRIGLLDEQFGQGFFEDDDLGVRARQAGFRLAVALDVFVHHFGGRTFAGLGIDCRQQLKENFERFKAKWGAERCAGYRLPEEQTRRPEGESTRLPEDHPEEGDGVSLSPCLPVSLSGRPRVSLCLIVKDAADSLGACLASAADLVDEVVVIDTGSTDGTREVAARAGAKVYDFAWVDSFAAARNESLRRATGRWVLWLDADERLDEDNRARLRALLGGLDGENVGYVMRQRSPLEASAHAAVQVDQVRLFPNHPGLAWRYRVHEQILPDLRRFGADVRHTDIVIDHAGFCDPARQGAKVERNLRLLQRELEEHPDDPFVLYNLGAVALTRGRTSEALELLEISLAHSAPGDTLEHKLFVLLVRGHQEGGNRDRALEVCRAGRERYPLDPELLFWEGLLLRDRGDLAGAESCFREVLRVPPHGSFTSVDAGLQSYRARHLLAAVYRQQGRLPEAEAQWRAALAEAPDFAQARLALAELLLDQGRLDELGREVEPLRKDPQVAPEAAVLEARGLLARREYGPARQILEEVCAREAKAVWPRVVLSHVLLQEGKDWGEAERVLREVLALDPGHPQARHNRDLLLRQQGRPPEEETRRQGEGETRRPEGDRTALSLSPGLPVSLSGSARPRVSLCMIVRNEEANLPDCLASVAGLVDEIVVVDTGSADATREVAARHGARVFDFAWVDSFAAARNESLRHASGDWVFWMDADDRLDEDNRARLRALIDQLPGGDVAFVMKCLCLPDPVTGVFTAVDHVRLFRNRPDLRWRYRVHEQILPALRQRGAEIRWSEVVVRHAGYQDPALRSKKLERDLRLLRLEDAERPDDPFTLFNLGSVYQELGQISEAVSYFRRSLERSQPADSIVRKLYALLAQCLRHLGRRGEALEACREGRGLYPDDVELLFQEALARREGGDPAGAERCLLQVLAGHDGPHFASVDTGLRGYKARHNLAVLCQEQGRAEDAEAHWRAALADRPDFLPAALGLGELFLAQRRWGPLEEAARALEALPGPGPMEAALLRARTLLVRRDFPAARQLLHKAVGRFPGELAPRVVLSHALLQEGRDWPAAEQVLRDVLERDPGHAESRHNLALLLEQQGRGAEAAPLKEQLLEGLYRAACATPSDINEHCPTLFALARECRHVTELGSRTGVPTAALLYARPARLVCYDTVVSPYVGRLRALAGPTEFVFRQADALGVDIEDTDLLFIDTWHAYDQLRAALRRHGGKARRYIVLHDTTAFGDRAEDPGRRGLWPAVEEFLAQGTFRLKERHTNNNGLTVLEAIRSGPAG